MTAHSRRMLSSGWLSGMTSTPGYTDQFHQNFALPRPLWLCNCAFPEQTLQSLLRYRWLSTFVKDEYALQAILDLASQRPGEPVSIADIERAGSYLYGA